MSTGSLRLDERDGGAVLATISNPPHALLDEGIVGDLEALLARAERDPELKAIVLTGDHPDRFVAHYDVGALLDGSRAAPSVGRRAARASLRAVAATRRLPGGRGALERTPAAGSSQTERFGEVLTALGTVGAVTVAALNGSAQGGGCELALACDIRLMAEGPHRMGQPEILFGFPPGGGGTQRLARMVGTAKALRLCLDGGPVSPEDALEIGIVDELVAPGELLDRALSLARRLGARPKAGIAGVKRAINLGASLPVQAGLRLERAEFMAAITTDESERSMAAYQNELERSGELPGYDAERMDRALDDGRFG